MATCSTSELMEAGKCFQCLSKKELWIVIAQLLCEIKSSPGLGVPAQILTGSVDDPNGTVAPNDSTMGAIYYRDTAGNDLIQMWRWSVADQIWKAVIIT